MLKLAAVNKILFISLNNIGDAVLSLPVLDSLREKFPQAKITVITGPRPKEIFEANPDSDEVIVFYKQAKLKDKIKLFFKLKNENFDLVVDLRNSFFGFMLAAKYKISPFKIIPRSIVHMKERFLWLAGLPKAKEKKSLFISGNDEAFIGDLFKANYIISSVKVIVISAGARSHTKRWPKEKFVELIAMLGKKFKAQIILVGDKDDAVITKYIADNSSVPVIDLAGRTTFGQLAALLKKADLVISNDSAVLHMASYLDAPIVAIFGITNELKYGPWSKESIVVKKNIYCRPCEKAQCQLNALKCINLIKVEDVFRAASDILTKRYPLSTIRYPGEVKRILIVRTDRIGDVVLSTPVIKALRDYYPNSYIAMIVSPYAKEIVEANPYLDEFITYDKDGKHKNWLNSIKFAFNLRKLKFDLALILHPTNRMHIITFFAGIKRRVGYDRKLGFLLTDRIKHEKQLGQKHESEYALDLVRYLGIEAKELKPFMPIKLESERWVDALFTLEGIKPQDNLLAIHPAASCPSKIWPQERFARVSDKLADKYGFKVLILAQAKDTRLTDYLIARMKHQAINLSGKTSISQMASILKRCKLFISNDSGPVHIASALGTPVISIFGRNQKGLSPQRWGPLGIKDKILHEDVGCIECLAHNCTKQFACLKAISVEDVLQAADSILK